MKKRMQFEEATMELILFSFDVVTTSGTEPFGKYYEIENTREVDDSPYDTSDKW